jgi:hypothetical protein
LHGGAGEAAEAGLFVAGVNVAEAGEPVVGLGDGEEVVVDGVVGLDPLDEETLFAAFGMIGESAVSETVAVDGGFVFSCGLVEHVHDASREEEPEMQERGAMEDGDGLGCARRRSGGN